MKKWIYIICSAAVLFFVSGCSSTQKNNTATNLKIVTTNFPAYDFTRAIVGNTDNIKMLLKPGQESHTYDPTPQDIIAIEDADIFIYTGGESDAWVEDMLKTIKNKDLVTIRMMDVVKVVEEEYVEGMEHDHTHSHSHGPETFVDTDVKDRTLSDWTGDWQSIYPYLINGTLDTVMIHKAEEDASKTVPEYFEYYETGYKTDVERIKIDTDSMTFYTNGKEAKANYEYKGFKILTYESGNKGVRYLFEAIGDPNGAPRFVQFSDHMISPTKSEHFHIYFGNDSFDALLKEMNNWPTYYDKKLTGKEIAEDMLGHDHSDSHTHGEYDEHVWTSPKNANKIITAIEKEIVHLDTDNADTYKANSKAYQNKIRAVDSEIEEIVKHSSRKELVFGDRFPLRYFVDQYGLTYAAAFPGCTAETEASAQTITYLVDKVKADKIPVVFHIELSNTNIAKTISEETGAKVLQFHSAHNVTEKEFKDGKTYVDFMKENSVNLKEALQ